MSAPPLWPFVPVSERRSRTKERDPLQLMRKMTEQQQQQQQQPWLFAFSDEKFFFSFLSASRAARWRGCRLAAVAEYQKLTHRHTHTHTAYTKCVCRDNDDTDVNDNSRCIDRLWPHTGQNTLIIDEAFNNRSMHFQQPPRRKWVRAAE